MSSTPPVDNFIFRLCYRWTPLLLVAFTFIITSRLLLGNSFTCNTTDENVSNDYLNVKCYDTGVYTLPTKLRTSHSKITIVDPSFEDFRRYQSYYSWVNLLFLVHAFNFYLPHLLWKSYEKGYMHKLTAGVQKFFDKEEKRGLELCYLAKYVLVTQGKHKFYTGMYIFFEGCNYAICQTQCLWLVHFFDVTGVPDFLPYVLGTWSDFKNFYFPSEGICELQKLSSPNTVTPLKALCQLPLSNLYMHMFLFLHVWYVLLTILCGLVLLYRILLLIPSLRLFAIKFAAPLSERAVLMSVGDRLSYSDWFFLLRLQKAMADIDFAQMMDKIAVVSQGKDSHKENEGRYSIYEDATKDFDSSATSPV